MIVGGGSAGCVLADRLSRSGEARVLLLEAGTRATGAAVRVPAATGRVFQGDLDWNYRTAPEAQLGQRRLTWPRGKAVGGTSIMNGQVYVRGHRADFDGWAEVAGPGWGYDAVLPYFRKSENNERGASPFHGTGGPLDVADLRYRHRLTRAFVQAAIETGIPPNPDFNGEELEGAGFVQVTQRRGMRWSAADAYLAPARNRHNLTVVTGAHVTRVVFDGRRAVAVEYLREGRPQRAGVGREVILSGGVVSSPQLLMLSGIGPGEHLRSRGIDTVHHLPGVGQNLQDHFGLGLLARITRPVSLLGAESVLSMLRYAVFRGGMLTSNVSEACAFLRTGSDHQLPDLELVFSPLGGTCRQLFHSRRSWAAGRVLPAARRVARARFDHPSAHGVTLAATPLVPKSVGFVELATPDPLEPPLIQPNYLSDREGEDMAVVIAGVRLARRLCRTKAFEPYVGEELLPGDHLQADDDLEACVRAYGLPAHHAVGTCRMGRDPMAVVDPQLRVHGVEGVRVVDGSVMPVMVRGHPYAATIMIAEKAADLILERRAGDQTPPDDALKPASRPG